MGSPLGVRVQNIKEWIINFQKLFWNEEGRDSEKAKIFVIVLWAIWMHRNDVILRKRKIEPKSIMESMLKIAKNE